MNASPATKSSTRNCPAVVIAGTNSHRPEENPVTDSTPTEEMERLPVVATSPVEAAHAEVSNTSERGSDPNNNATPEHGSTDAPSEDIVNFAKETDETVHKVVDRAEVNNLVST